MALDNLLSVSGKSGLYRLVGQMKNGIIVEGLDDGKRFPVHGSAKVSALEEISIYTEDAEIPLREVFDRIYEKTDGKAAMSHKEDKSKVKEFFSELVPEYDEDRVYVSDMVKVVKWFNQIMEHTDYKPGQDEEADSEEGEEGAEVKKAAPKKEVKPKAAPKPKAPKVSSASKGGSRPSTPRKAG